MIDRLSHHDHKDHSEGASVIADQESYLLKTALFLVSICDVVIVAQNELVDRSILDFLLLLDMLKSGITNPFGGNEDAEAEEHFPQLGMS